VYFFWCRCFPIALVLCAFVLGALELRCPGQGRRRRIIRLSGSTLLCVVGGLIWFGHLPLLGTVTPAQAWAELRYWGVVMALLLLLVMLAGLDSIYGARALKQYFEGVESEELERIRLQLRKR
jgi:hypothetical protein